MGKSLWRFGLLVVIARKRSRRWKRSPSISRCLLKCPMIFLCLRVCQRKCRLTRSPSLKFKQCPLSHQKLNLLPLNHQKLNLFPPNQQKLILPPVNQLTSMYLPRIRWTSNRLSKHPSKQTPPRKRPNLYRSKLRTLQNALRQLTSLKSILPISLPRRVLR